MKSKLSRFRGVSVCGVIMCLVFVPVTFAQEMEAETTQEEIQPPQGSMETGTTPEPGTGPDMTKTETNRETETTQKEPPTAPNLTETETAQEGPQPAQDVMETETTQVTEVAQEATGNRLLKRASHGVTNVVYGPLELPYRMKEEIKRSDPVSGLLPGLVKGLGWSIAREGVGLFEILTFFREEEPLLPEFDTEWLYA